MRFYRGNSKGDPFIVYFPMKNCDFPVRYIKLPESTAIKGDDFPMKSKDSQGSVAWSRHEVVAAPDSLPGRRRVAPPTCLLAAATAWEPQKKTKATSNISGSIYIHILCNTVYIYICIYLHIICI